MHRLALIAVAVLASLAVAAMSAISAPAGTEGVVINSRSLASVRLIECTRGPAADNRLALFRGAMRRVPGTRRMWMRFKLQERVGSQRFHTVKAPGLGVWRKSRLGVRRFAYRQRVLALAQGSAYRTVVSFRWYGQNDAIVRRMSRRSRACRQPGPLPNLVVPRISGGKPVAGAAGVFRYVVRVANRGQAPAPLFGVSLAVDGRAADPQTVADLAPGETRSLAFFGPSCANALTAVADPSDILRETIERDNSRTSACPLGR